MLMSPVCRPAGGKDAPALVPLRWGVGGGGWGESGASPQMSDHVFNQIKALAVGLVYPVESMCGTVQPVEEDVSWMFSNPGRPGRR